jgi:hypothetical protein
MHRIVPKAALVLSIFAWPLLALGGAPAGAAITVPPTVNATNWTAVTPSTGTSDQDFLQGVSCTTSAFCMAVGSTSASTGSFIEQWNGSTWTPVANPALTGSPTLNGVSCIGTNFCAAVGQVGSPNAPLIEQWNGTAWTAATVPAPPATDQSQLNAVSCASATDCVAVGSSVAGATTSTFIEQWNGQSWNIVTSPNPTGSDDSQLLGVSCSGGAFCMAAGSAASGTNTVTLIEQWNGTAWTIVTSPNPSLPSNDAAEFNAVSCAGAAFCQAVGESNASGTFQSLAETWNGTAWTIVPTPSSSASEDNFVEGVDCFSPTTCAAVGWALTPVNAFGPTAMSWNGTTWSAATTPSSTDFVQSQAIGVSCVTNWECVAAGSFTNSGTPDPFLMTAPIARSGYRFVASDGGVFAYGAGAPFLGSTGGMKLNKPIVGMAVMPAGDGYDLVASDGGIFTYGSAQFYGSTGSLHLNAPIVGMAMTSDGAGYWLVASDGGIFSYGDAQFYGSTGSLKLNQPIVGMAATPDGKGYWLVASDGGIFNYGDAGFLGSAGSLPLNKPVVGMTAPLAGGYYLVASDGGIFSYPTTNGPTFFGSTGSIKLNKPIVGMTAVAGGYYLSASDGGIFAFPTTNGPPFLGSTGSIVLNQPIVGMTA